MLRNKFYEIKFLNEQIISKWFHLRVIHSSA